MWFLRLNKVCEAGRLNDAILLTACGSWRLAVDRPCRTLLPVAAVPPLADPAEFVRVMAGIRARLAADLRTQSVEPWAESQIRAAHAADRAKDTPYEVYRDTYCDQVAASWVLCAVFVRVLEDRGHVPPRLVGSHADDWQAGSNATTPVSSERDYLLHVFYAVATLPGGSEIFNLPNALLWRLIPTSEVVSELLGVLRSTDGERLRFTFGRPPGDGHGHASTDYLGKLYEEFDPGLRSRYGLIRTPEFVGALLLDTTLAPAIQERGGLVTVLDPACGSGTLLLGAYDRLCEARKREDPALSAEELARTVLGQVYGIDLVPYAVAVTRFRLLLSYLERANILAMEQSSGKVRLQVYVGDSLLAGLDSPQAKPQQLLSSPPDGGLRVHDPRTDELLTMERFDVVVTSSPAVTEMDATKRSLLRKSYEYLSGRFTLSVPFIERLFSLGKAGAYTGHFLTNSFLKREFGRRVIEEVLPKWDLTDVIDTSGAYLPGYGSAPTVILLGRAWAPRSPSVRMLLCTRGEPSRPEVPAQGKVWSAIARHHFDDHYTDDFISVLDVDRVELRRHPWKLFSDPGYPKSPASQLYELLLSMFSADELRRFLRYHGSVSLITNVLPGPTASEAELVRAAVDTWLRWGAVDEALFSALRSERPGRVAEIEAVARAFGVGAGRNGSYTALELPPAAYTGPAPLYRSKDTELTSQRLLALYAAVEGGARGREYAREIARLHRSLRGEFSKLQPGDLLADGRYMLLSVRALSSVPGAVWHAYDRRLNREVALRVFNTTTDDPGFRAYVRGQAHAIARLHHPYIAEVFDPDVLDEPHYGYSTEFLRGGRLIDRIERLRGDGRAVAGLVAKLADGLAHAHAGGLVHGALEVRGIDFATDGEPRLRDFGLGSASAQRGLSHGVLPFLAPEILAGGEPSRAADQYGLAQIAAACLFGRQVPPAPHELAKIQASVGAIDQLVAALRRALSPDPEQRFPRMTEFVLALMDVAATALGNSVSLSRTSALHRTLRRATTSPPNPFSSGTPLDGTQVPGREDDVDRVLGLVAARGSALLLGPRRAGKTSLLRNLAPALAVEHMVRSISLEASPCDTPDALAVALAPEFKNVVSPARALAEQLTQEERWPVLLIDEIGYLRNADVRITPTVFSWLRAIGQGTASIVYAGSQSDWNQVLAVAKQQPGSSFGNDIIVHELGPLSSDAALAFLGDTAPPDVPIPAEPVGVWILECCGTWPFYLQVMGYSLVDAARRGDRRPLDDHHALYELYEARLLRERSHVFEGRWNELDARVRELILRDRTRLPEFAALPLADKKLLRDAGLYNALSGGWLLERDPPFNDWIRRKYDELKEA